MTGTIRQVTTRSVSFEWDIDDYFSEIQRADTSIKSPYFTFAESVWYLELFPNGERINNTVDVIRLYLRNRNSSIKQRFFTMIMGIKNGNDKCRAISPYCWSYKVNDLCRQYDSTIMTRTELIQNRQTIAPEGTLTVFIMFFHEPNMIKDTQTLGATGKKEENTANKEEDNLSSKRSKEDDTTNDQVENLSSKEGVDTLIKNLKDMFLNEVGCDVTFKVGDSEFRAHMSILVARSPVFASKFTQKFEKNSGIINIEDCSPEAFKELLLYLYSGTVDDLCSENVFDLYEAAVKYKLEYLRKRCFEFMQKIIAVDTFCEIMTISLEYNETLLLKYATDFFFKHVEDILKTPKWQLFLKEYSAQANELYMKAYMIAKN